MRYKLRGSVSLQCLFITCIAHENVDRFAGLPAPIPTPAYFELTSLVFPFACTEKQRGFKSVRFTHQSTTKEYNINIAI